MPLSAIQVGGGGRVEEGRHVEAVPSTPARYRDAQSQSTPVSARRRRTASVVPSGVTASAVYRLSASVQYAQRMATTVYRVRSVPPLAGGGNRWARLG